MSSNSSSWAPPQQGGIRGTLRRGPGLKRTRRSPSRSPPPSPRLGGLLAPPAVTRSISPALSDTSNQSTTARLVSGLSLSGAPHARRPSSALGDNSASTTSNDPSTNVPEPSTQHKSKKTKTVWTGLEIALETLKIGAGVFPPLKSAASDFASCIGLIKAAAENRNDYEELTSELETMIKTLDKYAKALVSEDINGSIANITLSITEEAKRIKQKQDRDKMKRILESNEDKEDVLRSYHRVERLFRQLQDIVIIWTAQKINKQDEANLLQGLSPEEDARYDSHYSFTIKRCGCTAETREKIQADLHDWVRDPNGAKVYWMNGMAGTGKTTIAYSVCEWLEANKQLGANFFCSRTKDSCSDVSRIVPTIACQFARYSPAFRSALCKVLESDPAVSRLKVAQQFEKLVRGPLSDVKAMIPSNPVVVIDALDECGDNEGVMLLLSTLMRFAASLPVKFFLASRPEPAIYKYMQSSGDYSPTVLRLHDIEESLVAGDIEKYLKDALNPMTPSPSDDQIKRLARQSGKLFIYAATVVRYILPSNVSVDSDARLKTMLGTGSQGINNSRSTRKYKELDKLYTAILDAVLNDLLEEQEIESIKLVLWTAVCAKEPLKTSALASLMALTEQQVVSALKPLQSVLHISEKGQLVSTLHASFPEYMLNHLRSDKFYCDKAKHNRVLASRCFEVMQAQLRFNICHLESSFIFDRDVLDLERQIEKYISSVLFYACRYWGEHLTLVDVSDAYDLSMKLLEFLAHNLLFWMEVLNLKQCIGTGVSTLRHAQVWLSDKNVLDDTQKLVADAFDFVTRFAASACTRSTPHIYVSALPFCPKSSSVYAQYWGRTRGLMNVKGTAIGRRAQAAIATWMTGSVVNVVIFSPDGRRVVSGSYDGTIQLRDARTGVIVLGPLKGHESCVNSVAFSPDGTHIVSGSDDGTIRVWNTLTDATTGVFGRVTSSVNSVAFSPNGACIISGLSEPSIRMWDSLTWKMVARTFTGVSACVNSVAFSPDSTRVVSGSSDHTIRMWDTRNSDTLVRFLKGHTDSVKSVAFSPDGTRIISGSDDRTVRVWDAQTGGAISKPFEGHTLSVNSIASSPDGASIVSGSDDRTVRLWDARTGKVIARPFEGHTRAVKSVAFSPDGINIISGSYDCTLRVWAAQSGNLSAGPLELEEQKGLVLSVAFSPDGTCIASGSSDRAIRLWHARTGDPVAGPFRGHTDRVNSVAFSYDSTHIVSGSSDWTIRMWDARTGDTIAGPFIGHTGCVNSVAFSLNGTLIASGSDDCTIRVWDLQTDGTSTVTRLFNGHTESVKSVAFSLDGTRIVSGSDDRTIRLWDAQTGGVISKPFEGHTHSVNSVAFSPNSTLVVSGSDDRTIRVWNAQTGRAIASPFEGHTRAVKSVAFSPSGSCVVSGADDCTVRLWDTLTGNAIAEPFKGHKNPVKSVAFSPDGTCIVSGSDDRTIRLWNSLTCNFVSGPLKGPRPSYKTVAAEEGNPDFSRRLVQVSGTPTITSFASTFAWQTSLMSRAAENHWNLTSDGWVTINHIPYVWISPDLQECFPLPPHPLAIGPQGSIQIESWDLILGKSWSLCYSTEA